MMNLIVGPTPNGVKFGNILYTRNASILNISYFKYVGPINCEFHSFGLRLMRVESYEDHLKL